MPSEACGGVDEWGWVVGCGWGTPRLFIWHAKCKNTNEHNAQNDFRQFNFLFSNSRYSRVCVCMRMCGYMSMCMCALLIVIPLGALAFNVLSACNIIMLHKKIKVTFGCFIAFALWGLSQSLV